MRCVVNGVASQATEMSVDVGLADFRFVAPSAAGQNDCGLHTAVTFNEFGIASSGVFSPGSVATFATTLRWILAFQRLRVGRFSEGLVDVFMTSLTGIRPGVFRVLVGRWWGVLRRYAPAHHCDAQKDEPV